MERVSERHDLDPPPFALQYVWNYNIYAAGGSDLPFPPFARGHASQRQNFCIKRRWKGLRIVSLTKRFFTF